MYSDVLDLEDFQYILVFFMNMLPEILVSGPASVIRGHKMRIKIETVPHCLPRKNFYSNRVACAWNSLSGCWLEYVSIN